MELARIKLELALARERKQMDILVLNGPNLNLLGSREPDVYGSVTLTEVEKSLIDTAAEDGLRLTCFQSNHEGELITRIHQAKAEGVRFIIINPAGYTHTSVALRDALLAVEIPFVEVHISNIHAREKFRHHSYFSDIAAGVIAGLDVFGYFAALAYVKEELARD